MKRVPSQDHLFQGSPQHPKVARLRCALAAASRSSIATTHLPALTFGTFSRISKHVSSDRLLRLSTGVIPSVVKPVGRTISKAANGFYGMLTAQHSADEAHRGDLPPELDWRPQLSLLQEGLCYGTAVLLCCAFYALTAPASLSAMYSALMALLCASVAGALRYSMLEAMYRSRQRQVSQLGDADSRFHELEQLLVHVKCQDAAASGQLPAWGIHCYHGFGSNTISWSLVQQQLAQQLGAVVTAHDMPGFGLTARPSDLERYYLDFNGRLGLAVLRHELAQRCSSSGTSCPAEQEQRQALDSWERASVLGDALADRQQQQQQQQTKIVLVGHSMGAACAALALLERPQEVGALVLVAPAIFALPGQGRELGLLVHERSRLLVEQPSMGSSSSSHMAGATAGAQAGGRVAAARADSACSLEEFDGFDQDASSSSKAGAGIGTVDRHDSVTSLGSASPTAKRQQQQGARSLQDGPTEHLLVLQLHPGESSSTSPQPSSGSSDAREPSRVQAIAKAAASTAQALAAACALAVIMLLRPLIVPLLRVLVRSKRFWQRGLASAYYDRTKLTAAVVDAYRLPQLVRGWEDGMLQFVLARLAGASRLGRLGKRSSNSSAPDTGSASGSPDSSSGILMVDDSPAAAAGPAPAAAAGPAAASSKPSGSLAEQLAAVVHQHSIPVLIVHGEQDRIVPISNSKRLARQLRGCQLAVYTQCGHMPQEELPEGFVATVTSFLQQVAAAAVCVPQPHVELGAS